MTSETPRGIEKKPQRYKLKFIVLGVILAVLAFWGISSRIAAENSLGHRTQEAAIPNVAVIQVQKGPQTDELVLPGNVEAWHEAPIYARTNGYLKSWSTDIGAQVKAGDVLAKIDTPDVDAQLHQAEADLSTAEANNALSQTTSKRWQALLKTNSVSKQEADEKTGDAAAKEAMVASAKANLDRLHQLEDFKRVVAPFDGTITARNTDVGALINAGSNGTGQELFHIVDNSKLRVYIMVPENYVGDIKPDLTADLHFPSYPVHSFTASLANTAEAINPATRTLLVQLQVDNSKNELKSGGYAEAHLHVPSGSDNVHLPVNALLFRNGTRAAVVEDDHASLKELKIGRDFGKEVEVLSGVTPGQSVIINPPDSLEDGQKVKIVSSNEQNQNQTMSKQNDTQKKDSGHAEKDKDTP